MRIALKVLLVIVCLLFAGLWLQRYILKQHLGAEKDVFQDSTGQSLSSGYFKEDTTGRVFFLVVQIAKVHIKDGNVMIKAQLKHNGQNVEVPITVVGQGKTTRQFLKIQPDRQFLPNQGLETVELRQQNSPDILKNYRGRLATLTLWKNYQDAVETGSDPAVAADLRCNQVFFAQLSNLQPLALDCAPKLTTVYVVNQ